MVLAEIVDLPLLLMRLAQRFTGLTGQSDNHAMAFALYMALTYPNDARSCDTARMYLSSYPAVLLAFDRRLDELRKEEEEIYGC